MNNEYSLSLLILFFYLIRYSLFDSLRGRVIEDSGDLSLKFFRTKIS